MTRQTAAAHDQGSGEVASTADRIRSAIEQAQHEAAKRLLLGYARDVGSPAFEDEAVILASRLEQVRRDRDLLGRDIQADQALVVGAMLSLVRKLEATSSLDDINPPSKRSRPVLVPIANTAQPASPNPDWGSEPEPTGLEQARQRFESGSQPLASSAYVLCRDLGRHYATGATSFALKDLSLRIEPGEIVGLVGENGSGKTTLLRILAGQLAHTKGTLTYPALGAEVEPISWPTLRPKIGYVPQNPPQWFGRLRTVLELVAAKHGILGVANRKEVDFWLHRLGLERYGNAKWTEISGGYQMRFEIARAMICRPSLLILDEPLAPLDVRAQRMFLQDLSDLASSRRRPLAMVVSSQHLYEIELVAHQLLFLRDGGVAYLGRPNDFTSPEGGNLFELACGLRRDELLKLLATVGECRVEQFGGRLLVWVPENVDGAALLKIVNGSGGRVEYFHDLSRSSRRLFDEGRHDV